MASFLPVDEAGGGRLLESSFKGHFLSGLAFLFVVFAVGAFVAAETAKWGKVVKFANLKPE